MASASGRSTAASASASHTTRGCASAASSTALALRLEERSRARADTGRSVTSSRAMPLAAAASSTRSLVTQVAYAAASTVAQADSIAKTSPGSSWPKTAARVAASSMAATVQASTASSRPAPTATSRADPSAACSRSAAGTDRSRSVPAGTGPRPVAPARTASTTACQGPNRCVGSTSTVVEMATAASSRRALRARWPGRRGRRRGSAGASTGSLGRASARLRRHPPQHHTVDRRSHSRPTAPSCRASRRSGAPRCLGTVS
jgi:hypothetical protein